MRRIGTGFLITLSFIAGLVINERFDESLKNTVFDSSYYVCWRYNPFVENPNVSATECDDPNVGKGIDSLVYSIKDSSGRNHLLATCDDKNLNGLTIDECSYNFKNIEKYLENKLLI